MLRFHRFDSLLQNIRWLFRAGGFHKHLDDLSSQLERLETQIKQLDEKLVAQSVLQRRRAWVSGHQMLLDPDDTVVSRRLCEEGVFEQFETDFIQRLVRPGQTVLDIGANIGYYTLMFARLVGPSGAVFAFEPDPHNFDLLRKNVQQNGYRNVTLVPKAVSDASSQIKLFLNPENRGDHRIYDLVGSSEQTRETVDVEAIALDDYFADHDGDIHFIKMDIQGAEASAMKGMQALLKRHRQLSMVLEFWPRGLHATGTDPEAFLRTLHDLDFDVHEIDEQAEQIAAIDVPKLLARLPREPDTDILFTNLYCTPKTAPSLRRESNALEASLR